MPEFYQHEYRRKTWRTMSGQERKQWYRDNATTIARGLKPLKKP